MWNLDPPLTVYVRHMPHWRQDGATYFVTFRLSDSLPESRLRELADLKADWQRRHPPPRSREVLEQLARMVFERIERWLDRGMGSCMLREERLAELVAQALRHFHEDRYELGCAVVMPNHAHAIVRPLHPRTIELEDIIGSWKSYTARRINAALGRTGGLWQEESYDRIIRNEEHLWKSIQYIGRNPEKAGLPRDSCHLWVNPQWESLGWTFQWRRS